MTISPVFTQFTLTAVETRPNTSAAIISQRLSDCFTMAAISQIGCCPAQEAEPSGEYSSEPAPYWLLDTINFDPSTAAAGPAPPGAVPSWGNCRWPGAA